MLVFIQDNFNLMIASLSLIVSIFVYSHYRRIAKMNSYNQKGTYIVSFAKRSVFAFCRKQQDISVKLYNSILSDIMPFDYTISISSLTGGVYRTQMFSNLDDACFIGINKTLPQISRLRYKRRMPRKYAGLFNSHFSSSPLFPYFCANSNINTSNDMKLNRYHFYIEISDYCDNTQIWYISFSLLLSNKKIGDGWRNCEKKFGFDFFKYDDLNIISPKDILKNHHRTLHFSKTLGEIKDEDENSLESKALTKNGFQQMNADLQLFEMKKYISFLDELKSNNYI